MKEKIKNIIENQSMYIVSKKFVKVNYLYQVRVFSLNLQYHNNLEQKLFLKNVSHDKR